MLVSSQIPLPSHQCGLPLLVMAPVNGVSLPSCLVLWRGSAIRALGRYTRASLAGARGRPCAAAWVARVSESPLARPQVIPVKVLAAPIPPAVRGRADLATASRQLGVPPIALLAIAVSTELANLSGSTSANPRIPARPESAIWAAMKRLPLSDEAGRQGKRTASGHQLALMMAGRRRLQRVINNNQQWATCAFWAPERLHDSFHERDKLDQQ